MKDPCYQIQILSDSEFILRRVEDGWEAVFNTLREALDYADSLADGENDGGARFLRAVY